MLTFIRFRVAWWYWRIEVFAEALISMNSVQEVKVSGMTKKQTDGLTRLAVLVRNRSNVLPNFHKYIFRHFGVILEVACLNKTGKSRENFSWSYVITVENFIFRIVILEITTKNWVADRILSVKQLSNAHVKKGVWPVKYAHLNSLSRHNNFAI